MKWIKGVDRVPDHSGNIFIKISGTPNIGWYSMNYDMFVSNSGCFYPAEIIEWLDESTDCLPSIEDAGIAAVKMSEEIEPSLQAKEQSFFVAGFQECIKWLCLNY